MTKPEILAEAIYKNNEGMNTTTHGLGDGEWSIEVRTTSGEYLFELVGENGTNSHYSDGEASDLWGELSEIQREAESIAIGNGWKSENPINWEQSEPGRRLPRVTLAKGRRK